MLLWFMWTSGRHVEEKKRKNNWRTFQRDAVILLSRLMPTAQRLREEEQWKLEEDWMPEELERTLWSFKKGAVIHKDQSCGVPGRQIHGALVQLRDVLQLERERRQSIAILNLDPEKAYDSVPLVPVPDAGVDGNAINLRRIWEKFAWKMLYKDKRTGGRGMPGILLFLWAKYMSTICKLVTEADIKMACLIRNALWKARNLLLYRQMDVEVMGCVKMALSKLRTYHQKAVAEDGEDTANTAWHRDMWHRTIQPPPREEESDGTREEEQTSGTEDNDSDSSSSSGSSSGSWSDNDEETL
ncbi:hypothetical protein Y1Q_0004333 [Alligator mississippiensis]|uniref:Uncharacterized protein n=1 Tax=Alligator mississippiensis TaxID=8496 RepID=A0A151MIH0_ALLMI|nr:hypothetical protein Y1Q_0004333 [Alligator mississippiensis]